MQKAGLLGKGKTIWWGRDNQLHGDKINKSKLKKIYPNKPLYYLVKHNELKPGDTVGEAGRTHTMTYRGKKNGKYYFYSVGPTTTKGKKQGNSMDSGYIKKHSYTTAKAKRVIIKLIIRPK